MQKLPGGLPQSLINDIRRYGFELGDGGLVVPRTGVMVGGVFDYERRHLGNRDDAEFWSSHNLVVDQGLHHILDVVMHASTQVTAWYTGLFEGNYAPVAGDTAATFPASATECTAYDEATRVAYNEAAAAAKVTTNAANRAEFTINATKTIYGGFLSSVSTKGATTGTLLAADRGSVAKSVVDNDVLLVTYSLTLAAT